MTAIVRTLDAKLKQWRPATVRKVVRQVALIIRQAEKPLPPQRKSSSRRISDPLMTDRTSFKGSTPADLAGEHDRYLYGN